MGSIQNFIKFFTYKPSQEAQPFVLEEGIGGSREGRKVDKKGIDIPKNKKVGFEKPLSPENWNEKKNEKEGKGTVTPQRKGLDTKLATNLKLVEAEFNIPLNVDAVIRSFKIGTNIGAFIIYMEGMADRAVINDFILRPLMATTIVGEQVEQYTLSYIADNVLNANEVCLITEVGDLINHVLRGNTVLFIEGAAVCLAIDTTGFEKRAVGNSKIETVVVGSQEAFTENLKTNVTLIRRAIKNSALVNRQITIGGENNMLVSMLYIDGIANPAVTDEVMRRLKSIRTDFSFSGGMLEQFIEDHPLLPCPQTLVTERPDRVAFHLAEGRVAILGDNSPFAIIVPMTFFALLQSAEDQYLRWQYATALRFVRIVAVYCAVFLAAFYVAVVNFHHQLISTDILGSLVVARENIPFPTVIEVLLLEVAFELIREGGLRIPGAIGATLGIIGALILGQAAVAANIVSPITIIIVALGGLGNFAIPSYHLAFSLRILRFFMIIAGSIFGFFGIAIMLTIVVANLSAKQSFGVPYFAPIAPRTRSNCDTILKYPVWQQEERPDYLNTIKEESQPHKSMGWRWKSQKPEEE